MNNILKQAMKTLPAPSVEATDLDFLHYEYELAKIALASFDNVKIECDEEKEDIKIFWKDILLSNYEFCCMDHVLGYCINKVEAFNAIEPYLSDTVRIVKNPVKRRYHVNFDIYINGYYINIVELFGITDSNTLDGIFSKNTSDEEFADLKTEVSKMCKDVNDLNFTINDQERSVTVFYDSFNLGTYKTVYGRVIPRKGKILRPTQYFGFLQNMINHLQEWPNIKKSYPLVELKKFDSIDGTDYLFFDISAYKPTVGFWRNDTVVYDLISNYDIEFLFERVKTYQHEAA